MTAAARRRDHIVYLGMVKYGMVITINGKPEEVRASVLLDLLSAKQIEPHMVAMEVNDVMIERNRLGSTLLKEGDRIEFLFYMGGGR